MQGCRRLPPQKLAKAYLCRTPSMHSILLLTAEPDELFAVELMYTCNLVKLLCCCLSSLTDNLRVAAAPAVAQDDDRLCYPRPPTRVHSHVQPEVAANPPNRILPSLHPYPGDAPIIRPASYLSTFIITLSNPLIASNSNARATGAAPHDSPVSHKLTLTFHDSSHRVASAI